MQTKKMTHIEVLANQALGIIIGWLIVRFAFPVFGVNTTSADATISTIIFFIASYIRTYTIRRIFNKLHRSDNNR